MKSEANIARRSEPKSTQIILDNKQRSWWNSLSDGQRRFVASLSIILGVSIIGLIAWFFINRKVKATRASKVQTQSFGSDKHATWAKQFMQAFDNDLWWGMGTNEELIRQVMRSIPSKEDFTTVAAKYKIMTKGSNLVTDISSELSSTEYDEMMAILGSKPEKAKGAENYVINDPKGWAKRLHAAVNYYSGWFPGTDEDAIKAVFQEFPNKQAFYNTAGAYRKLYGVSLWTDLDGDLDWSMDWRALIKKK